VTPPFWSRSRRDFRKREAKRLRLFAEQPAHRDFEALGDGTSFLILSWVRVPHLTSHILSRVCRRLSRDWQEKYGHPIELVETFVERERIAGTCYRAAGWVRVGATTGRGRDGGPAAPGSVKEVYLRLLRPDSRQRLGG
jgi:hypothetical protein